jgi:hypothetical protein
LVADFDEKEAAGGGCGSGRDGAAGGEAGFEIGAGEVAFAGFEEDADEVADHVLEEAAAADAIAEALAFEMEAGGEDAADFGEAGGVLFVGGGEGGEIVLAFEDWGERAHDFFVERVGVVEDVAALEGRADFAAEDAVFVRLFEGVEAGMEGGRGFGDAVDADVRREEAIEGFLEVGGRDGVLEIEGGDLGEGVDSGIGAAGGFDADGGAFDFGEDLFELALDGGQAGLDLPAVVFGAVVGEFDADAAQGAGSGGAGAWFDDGDAGVAHGAAVGFEGGDVEGFEGDAGDADIDGAAATVDDGAGGEDACSGGLGDFDDFAGAAAGGDDIFDDDDGFAGLKVEAAAEAHFADHVAFGEEEAGAEGAGGFVADDEAAEGGRGDGFDGLGGDAAEGLGHHAAELFGVGGVLEDEGGLEVFAAVLAAGEAEVAAEVGAGFGEEVQYGTLVVGHIAQYSCPGRGGAP